MLLRSLYNGVPIYTVIDTTSDASQFEHLMGMGDPVVWTGKATTLDAAVGPETFYEVYAPVQGTSGWVFSDNVEEVK